MSIEFKWTAELLAEFIKDYSDRDGTAAELMEQFKEIKQPKPEWEIIQVSSPECGLYFLDGYKMRPNDKIYSVKRLSDNLIIKIGDTVGHRLGDACLSVSHFEVRNNDIYAIDEIESINRLSFSCKNWKKINVVLFITQDGVEVLNSHLYVCSVGKSTFEISECRAGLIQKGHHDHYFYFSCRAKAEEYILMNKPLFSISEIASDIINHSIYKTDYMELFIKIAKEKLTK